MRVTLKSHLLLYLWLRFGDMCSEVAKFVEPSLGRKEYIDVAFERDSQPPSVKRCAGFWSKKGLNALKYNYCDYILFPDLALRQIPTIWTQYLFFFSLHNMFRPSGPDHVLELTKVYISVPKNLRISSAPRVVKMVLKTPMLSIAMADNGISYKKSKETLKKSKSLILAI